MLDLTIKYRKGKMLTIVSPVLVELLVGVYFLSAPTHVLELPVSIKRVSSMGEIRLHTRVLIWLGLH